MDLRETGCDDGSVFKRLRIVSNRRFRNYHFYLRVALLTLIYRASKLTCNLSFITRVSFNQGNVILGMFISFRNEELIYLSWIVI
jgi:hypothetical protein